MNLRNLIVKISMCLFLAGVLGAQTPAGTFTPIRMHDGGGAYVDSQGQTWSADTSFSGGKVFTTKSSIQNTADPALYQTERYGSFSYQFAAPNGNYNVVLKFAELYWNSVGKRSFNVSIDGTQVLANFDIVAAAGAPLTAIDKTFPVTVTNGTVTIQFTPGSADQPKVSAIEITQPSGVGNPPPAQGQLSLSQTSFAFGNINIGATTSQIFTLSNTGTAAMTFSGAGVSGRGFSATGVSNGVMLNPGQRTTLTVNFAPAAVGPVTGSVTITSNATNASAAIVLSGTGVQPVVAHSVVLTWDQSVSPSIIGYYVYRGTTPAGSFALMTTSTLSATTFTDSAVQSRQPYYYVVRSVDSSHTQSADSNEVSVTLP